MTNAPARLRELITRRDELRKLAGAYQASGNVSARDEIAPEQREVRDEIALLAVESAPSMLAVVEAAQLLLDANELTDITIRRQILSAALRAAEGEAQ